MSEVREPVHTPPSGDAVQIVVNANPVVLPGRHTTGLQIKEAAIRAGVPIQLDFVLSEVRPHGEQKIVSDDQPVNVKGGEEFWAIPGDDNS